MYSLKTTAPAQAPSLREIFDRHTLAALAADSGFTIEQRWTDTRGWFADVLMIATQ